jgi:hypothetical protein
MPIPCNEINQTANSLLMNFEDCSFINPEDLRTLTELVLAVYNCDTGPNYNTSVDELYESVTDETVTYPINNFHAISVTVLEGTIEYAGATLPTGSYISKEFSTLNQTAFTIVVKANAKVLIERIIEDI